MSQDLGRDAGRPGQARTRPAKLQASNQYDELKRSDRRRRTSPASELQEILDSKDDKTRTTRSNELKQQFADFPQR